MRRLYFFWVWALLGSLTGAAQVTADFTFSPNTGCNPAVVQFTNASTGAASYSWNFGNGAPASSLVNPSTTYTATGTFSITLTATAANGTTSVKTKSITINPAPTVSFTALPVSGCPSLAVQFSGTASANMTPNTLTYLWNFGNGSSSTSQNPSYTYLLPGTYNVAFAAVNAAGCTTLVQQTPAVTVFTPPVVAFSASDTALCNAPATTSFSTTTTGTAPLTYAWSFGDNTTGTGAAPSKTYNSLGTYTVKLVATDGNGCKDSATRIGYIQLATPPTASFTAPSSACVGAGITFTAGGSGTARTWYFGDGTSTVGAIASKVYAAPGTYTVKLVARTGLCSDSVTRTITIHPKPAPSFTLSPSRPCPPPASAVQFTNTTPGTGNTYQWAFGDGTGSTAANPSHTYGDGIFSVVLTATNSFGCADSIRYWDTVRVYPLTLGFQGTPVSGCAPLTVQFDKNLESAVDGLPIPYPGTVVSYTWTFGDGSAPVTGPQPPSHVYTGSGVYLASLTVTTANGCTVTESDSIRVGSSGQTPAFLATKQVLCVKQLDTLISSTPGTPNTIYQWQIGSQIFLSGTTNMQSFQLPDTGYYDVTLLVINNGCADTLTKKDYLYVSPPVSFANLSYSCDTPNKLRCTNLSKGYTTVKWYFGDNTTSTVSSPAHIYAALGTYTISQVTTNSSSGCKDSAVYVANLYDAQLAFAADDSAVCKETQVTFTQAVAGAPIQSYRWRVKNDLLSDSLPVVSYFFADTGHYSVTLRVRDGHDCIDSLTKTGYVTVAHPYVNFSATPLYGCAPQPVQFNDLTKLVSGTTAQTRVWTYGDATTVTGTPGSATPTHTYTGTGTYDVQLVVVDNIGCSDTLLKPAYLMTQAPHAAFNGNGSACQGIPVAFLNASVGGGGNGLTYEWDFGDGSGSAVENPQHAYTTPGTYTVRLIAISSNGCRDTVIKSGFVIVNNAPNAAFTQSDTFSICSPKLIQFTNTSTGALSYNWNFGNSMFSTLPSPNNVYTGGGLYTVTLVASGVGGCKDTATATVHLLGTAGALSYGPRTGCAPLTVNFTTGVTNVPSFIFDYADGSTYGTTGSTATHTYTEAGTYIPKLIMTDNTGCSATSIGLDTVKVDGVIAGFTTNPNPVCGGGTVQFTDTSKGSYSTVVYREWRFGGGAPTTAANPTQTYTTPGSYPVTMISRTSTGCRDTFESVVIVHPIPVMSAGPDTTVCVGDAATLQPSGGVSYTWQAHPTLSCTACTNPEARPTVPTEYIVTGTDSAGCTDDDTVRVSLKTKTASTVTDDTAFCAGGGVQLLASGAQSYQWTPPTGLSSAGIANPYAQPATTTTYTVIAREGSCIPDTQRVTVRVEPIPTVNAGPDQTMVAGNTVPIGTSVSTGPVTYAWTPETGLSCTNCDAPEATPKHTTTYAVVTRTPFGCSATDSVKITVVCQQSQVYIPNTFTPNGDGENERFYPRGKGIEVIKSMRIFNRWGEKVFEAQNVQANDAAAGWDGSYKGQPVSPDVYVFIIEGVCDAGEEFQWQGDVGVVR